MQNIVEQLRLQRHRNSTTRNYYGIWKNFNNFVIKLDIKPDNWEDRIVLYVAYLSQRKRRSATIKSYISAIKAVLFSGGIRLKEDNTLLAALTRVCKLDNDIVHTKLPIKKSLVRLLIQTAKKAS